MPVSPFIAPNNIYEMFHYIPEIDTFFDPPDFDLAEKFVAYHDYFGCEVLFTQGHHGDSYVPFVGGKLGCHRNSRRVIAISNIASPRCGHRRVS